MQCSSIQHVYWPWLNETNRWHSDLLNIDEKELDSCTFTESSTQWLDYNTTNNNTVINLLCLSHFPKKLSRQSLWITDVKIDWHLCISVKHFLCYSLALLSHLVWKIWIQQQQVKLQFKICFEKYVPFWKKNKYLGNNKRD